MEDGRADDAVAALGLERLRPGQRRAVDALASGRDALVVMPTGAGKTAVALVAGAALGGTTVVVSPLRALQRDQLPVASRVGPSRLLNADLSAGRRRQVLEEVAAGEVRHLLVGPEQLQRPDLVAALAEHPPALLAVDEAHCLSAWGPDFRPDYLRLGAVVELLDHPVVVAMTATAAPPVRRDITARLHLRDPTEVVEGFDRPEIHLAVEHHHDPDERDRALVERVAATPGSGLVYTATRARTVALRDLLGAAGVDAAAYHGSLGAPERREVEAAWKAGRTRVVVATTAFGMGIDKPDVRWVFHAEVPDSLDAYAQEVGRAGRDGAAASAVLLHRAEDGGLRRWFATRRPPPPHALRHLLDALRAADGPVAVEELGRGRGLARALAAAEAAGAVHLVPGGAVELAPGGPGAGEVATVVAAAAEAAEALERSRVEMVERYAASGGCRRRVLLGYFGEEAPAACGNCDVCERDAPQPDATPRGGGRWGSGDRVAHATFGLGEVLSDDGSEITVVFDEAGYRTLDAGLTAAGDLLSPAT